MTRPEEIAGKCSMVSPIPWQTQDVSTDKIAKDVVSGKKLDS